MIQSVSREGGVPRMLAADLNGPGAIAVSDHRVFWTCTLDDWQTEVSSVSLNGGVPEVFANGPPEPYQLTTDATNLYWTTKDSVMKVPLRGGQPTPIATGLQPSNGVVVDSGVVYFTDEESVLKVAATGGPSRCSPTVLASAQEIPLGIALDDINVYWTTQSNSGTQGTVMKLEKQVAKRRDSSASPPERIP
jgi:hypothetical protein